MIKKGHDTKNKPKAPTKKKTELGFFLEIFKIHSLCGEFYFPLLFFFGLPRMEDYGYGYGDGDGDDDWPIFNKAAAKQHEDDRVQAILSQGKNYDPDKEDYYSHREPATPRTTSYDDEGDVLMG
jgi:hypothetical protein